MHFPIHVELRRSGRLSVLLTLTHVLAAASVWVLPWPTLPKCLLLLLIAVSAWQMRRPLPVTALRLAENGGLLALRPVGDPLSVSIANGSVVFSQLIVLRLGTDEENWSGTLVLLPDSMSAERFRVLRLWLCWRADPYGSR